MPAPISSLKPLQMVSPVLTVNNTVPNTYTLSIDSSVLPVVALADTNTVRLEVSIYNETDAVSVFTTANGKNQFTTSLPIITTIAETSVQIIGRNYDPNATWLPTTTYPVGYRYADPNGNVQVVVKSTGNSGVLQPAWSLKTPSAITNISVSNNTAIVTCNNSFVPGQQVYLTGLTNATYLNGLVLTVVTASSTQFTAALVHIDVVPTVDTGSADSVTVDGGISWANYGYIAITPTVKFNLLFFQSDLAVAIAPPSGVTAKMGQNSCTLQWVTPDYPGFIGVRVQISTDYAGVNPPYTQYGDLVVNVNSTAQTVINSVDTTQVNIPTSVITNVEILNNLLTIQSVNTFTVGTVVSLAGLSNAAFLNGETVTITSVSGTEFQAIFTSNDYTSTPDNGTATSIISTNVVTSTQTVMATNFSTLDIPMAFVNSTKFYAVLSTVIQDPTTNIIYESVLNGPITCGFVNLKLVSPTDFPVLQRKEDIAGRLIGQITRQRPDLDLSPRSEIRDIFIDPFSIEASNMAVREWFARCAQSISAISQIDDSTGTGVSDPFNSSPYKQQIARAYGLSGQDTQNLIDEQFNILGEQAGLTRGVSSNATVVLTFYTYQQPQQTITIPQQAVVATASDSNTPSLSFVTTGQGVIDINNLASFYNAQYGWWSVSVPAQCLTNGSIGNVGAGSIRQIVSGLPAGINVTNLVSAQYGTDQESNASYGARIQARTVTGVDTGTRHGYLVTALSTPGIVDAQVVAAGDLEMIRDWDAIRQKHVFGTVDIYTRGTTLSQQDETIFFKYTDTGSFGTFSTNLSLLYTGNLKFQINNFSNLTYPLYSAVNIAVFRSGTLLFYLNTDRAQIDNTNGNIILNASDIAYQYVGSPVTQARVPYLINGNPATNQTAMAAVSGSSSGTFTYTMFARYESPMILTPSLQPVLQVFSVAGQANQTGVVPNTAINLIHTSDFLLNGGSNDAGDEVQVSIVSSATTKTITAHTANPTLIDIGMDVPVNSNGVPTGISSVRSTDESTLYINGVDYKIVSMGPYHQYGLQVLSSSVSISAINITNNVLTVTATNEFGVGASITLNGLISATFLNGQVVTVASSNGTSFTAAYTYADYATHSDTGTATGSAIQDNQQVIVAYNKFVLYERLSFVSNEAQVLHGTLPNTLANNGFVNNTWLPESYGRTDLILDGWNGYYGPDGGLDITGTDLNPPQAASTGLVGAQVPHNSRYIKVTYFDGVNYVVKKEGIDFKLTFDSVSGACTIARILTGTIPDGGTVLVSYFYLEPFTVSTEYPAFVEVLANQILVTKHAAADVLVKAMTPNPVDITMAVTLNPNTSPEAVDSTIRTVVNIVLDNAAGTLYQSELIRQVQAITGIQSVQLPLIKCAKSDGSYDIGVVVPTGTSWTKLSADPAFASLSNFPQNSWISTSPILPDSTLPSGGEDNAIVDFLYQGQVFTRMMSVNDFITKSISPPRIAAEGSPGNFYIIGTNDPGIPAAYQTAYAQKVLLVVPQDVPNPGNLSYLCTYQVFNEGGAKDITVSSTEYLAPGRITINYITG